MSVTGTSDINEGKPWSQQDHDDLPLSAAKGG
jgi:hypothetical protein